MTSKEVQWNRLMEVFNTNDPEVQDTEWDILEWIWEKAIPSFDQASLRKVRDHIRIIGQYNTIHWELMAFSCVIPSVKAIADEVDGIDLPTCFRCEPNRI